MKVAAFDLGSNTFLMLIAVVNGGRIEKVLVDESEVVRLGQGVSENKKFHKEALVRADNCLKRYSSIMKDHGVHRVVAVATSAGRDATNKEALLSIGREQGIPISVISGDEEARLTYKGSTFDLDCPHEYAVIDIGGGSTEILGLNLEGDLCGCSLDIGSVRLTEMFIGHDPIQRGELDKMDAYIDGCLAEKKALFPLVKKIVAVAGTPTTLAAINQNIDFDENLIHGLHIDVRRNNSLS